MKSNSGNRYEILGAEVELSSAKETEGQLLVFLLVAKVFSISKTRSKSSCRRKIRNVYEEPQTQSDCEDAGISMDSASEKLAGDVRRL
jgi:hypothetical protein